MELMYKPRKIVTFKFDNKSIHSNIQAKKLKFTML